MRPKCFILSLSKFDWGKYGINCESSGVLDPTLVSHPSGDANVDKCLGTSIGCKPQDQLLPDKEEALGSSFTRSADNTFLSQKSYRYQLSLMHDGIVCGCYATKRDSILSDLEKLFLWNYQKIIK